MIALLLGTLLFFQGTVTPPSETGTITGTIKTAGGEPAAGIRITAEAAPENGVTTASAASFASLAQTDDSGRYRLDNVPPGRYYITAGRVDLPTYFPGTLDISKGTPVAIVSSVVVPNIDFVMDVASVRPAAGETNNAFVNGSGGLTMPVHVGMAGAGKQPVSANNQSVVLRLTRTQDQNVTEMPLTSSDLNFPIPASIPGTEFHVSVENLPAGYAVKSMIQDGEDLLHNPLKITAGNFVQPPAGGGTRDASGPQAISSIGKPMTPLEITLESVKLSGAARGGVTVKGRAATAGSWYLTLTGATGILFEDGSFEFRGVPPGRHVILLQDKPGAPDRLLAASVVAGASDLDDVLADETPLLPGEVRFPAATPPPGTVPLAWIHGSVVDDSTRQAVFGGLVTVSGKTKAAFPIDSEGQFQIPRLLPGTYALDIEGAHHAAVHRNVTIGDEDVQLDVTAPSSN